MLGRYWDFLKTAAYDFVDDNALSRGAAIAYYTVFSIAPVLVIVIAIAGLVFGQQAAEGAIFGQLRGLMGNEAAATIQNAVRSASNHGAGVVATVIGVVTLIITASGIFSEMQSALNAIWKAQPTSTTVSRLVWARLKSLGLVMSLGFLLLVSLVVSAALQAIGTWMNQLLPIWPVVLEALNFIVSFAMVSLLFGAIYKLLPDKRIAWRDVAVGAVATAFMFTVGKFLIGLYIGSSSIASSYGAAGALAILLIWIYYSAQIFLFGAEFTKVYAERQGSHAFDADPQQSGSAAKADLPDPGIASTSAQIAALRHRLRAEQRRRRR
jgi:membrane protein